MDNNQPANNLWQPEETPADTGQPPDQSVELTAPDATTQTADDSTSLSDNGPDSQSNDVDSNNHRSDEQTPVAQNPEPTTTITDTGSKQPIGQALEIHWTASDSIEHNRGKNWYIGAVSVIIVVAIGLVVLAMFKIMSLMSAITTGLLAVVALIALLVVSKKPTRQLNYILTDAGLTIEDKLYPFSNFRAFGVQQIGALWQLVLVPVRRFGMSITIFIHEDQGEQIVDALGARLPMEDIKVDLVDKITHHLKI
jgi:hypothetical protein